MSEGGFTHVDATGAARMVDVSAKAVTVREATATGLVRCAPHVVQALRDATVPKGDVLAVARLAGIMATKRTPELVPLAHPVAVHGVVMDVEVVDDGCGIAPDAEAQGRTGRQGFAMDSLHDQLLPRNAESFTRALVK